MFAFVANTTSYQNNNLTTENLPLLNITGTIPGPLNPNAYIPYLAPVNTTGAGGGPTYFASNVNMSLNASTAPAPVNLTAASTTNSAVVGVRAGMNGIFGAAFAVVITGLLL